MPADATFWTRECATRWPCTAPRYCGSKMARLRKATSSSRHRSGLELPGHALLHRRLRVEAQPGIVHAQMPVEHDIVGEPLELLERAESAVDGAVLGAVRHCVVAAGVPAREGIPIAVACSR